MSGLSLLVFLTLLAIPSIADSSNKTHPCNSNELPCNVTITQPCNKGNDSSPTCSLFNNHTASWECCLCDTNQTNCCRTCNATSTVSTTLPSTTLTTATPATILPPPPEYARILVIFFDRCSEYVNNEAKFIESFLSSVANLTNIDRNRLKVDGISCSKGPKPDCGIDIDTIHKHHRARRAVGGGRGRGGGSDKKKNTGIDSGFFKDYYNAQEPDCDGLVVNATLKPPSLNKTLELMISHLYNRTFDIIVYDDLVLTAERILTAEKGARFSLYKARPLPSFYPQSPKYVPPLKTDLRPLIYTAGSIIAFVTLYIVIRLIKHSILLRMNKFTKINSNKTRKKVTKADIAKKKTKVASTFMSPYNMTHSKLPTIKNEGLGSTYNWTASAQLPNTLAPAYRPTDLTGQQSPPRLILDESDEERSSPIGGASVIDLDVGEDEVFDDILLSDSEDSEKQKRRGTASRSLASSKSCGSGKSTSTSDENRRSGTGYMKSRNKVSPNDMRRQSAVSKSSRRDSSSV